MTWSVQGGSGSLVGRIPDDGEHIFLVAVSVNGASREHAEARLMALLPTVDGEVITSWWVAEDDRHDGSDNDSACFVRKGNQNRGFLVLNYNGLTSSYNDPRRQRQ